MKKSITIQRRAHFHLQIPNKNITSVLVVIHGYGQKAADFINEFKMLKASGILVIAPEAISKFYNRKGEAVANWMTSHERLDEIDDYCNYLNQLLEKIEKEYVFNQLSILGFSQGVSTAFRWISTMEERNIQLFACAGSIPPELSEHDFKENNISVNYYYGDEDRLLKKEKAIQEVERIKQLGLSVKSTQFKGRHEVPMVCLKDILSSNSGHLD